MLKKNDILLIGILLAVALGSWGFGWISSRNTTASQVEIWQNTVLVGSYPLISEQSVTVPLDSEFGYNVLIIENGTVRMLEAACPDQLCVKTGPISQPGQTIVCLPNRIVVEITGEKEGEIDDLSQ